MQRRIPCVLMRDGTHQGPLFLASDLPAETPPRDRVLLAAMGPPDLRGAPAHGAAPLRGYALIPPSVWDGRRAAPEAAA